MREIHRYKTVKDGDRERKIQLFNSTDEILEGMNICLESISIIRRLLRGMKYEVFVNSRAVLDRCAINYQIIGNQMGRLDDSLKSNRAMETAYGARNMVAHWYGTPTYRTDLLYADLVADLDFLEDGCREIIEMVESGEIVVSDNKKRGLFRRRSAGNSEGMCGKDPIEPEEPVV